MAIARKPKPSNSESVSSVNVDALIAKGGSVAQSETIETTTTEESPAAFTLRVPKDVLKRLDDHLKKGPYKIPRQQWILEALVQRLDRENAQHISNQDS